jgi:hypothetical protein
MQPSHSGADVIGLVRQSGGGGLSENNLNRWNLMPI